MRFGYTIAYVPDMAASLAAPVVEPWGPTVSYVRCPDGILVEPCTPVEPPPPGA